MGTTLSAAKLAEVKSALIENPSGMTSQLARRLGVPEAEVIRALPDGRGVELDISRWQELFAAFEELGEVHVIVTNASVTCETVGQFGGFSIFDEFFNVQTKSLDMHIRWQQLGSVFAVEKPGHLNRARTISVQFYDKHGDVALKVFLSFGNNPTPQREEWFRKIKERFSFRPAAETS